MFEIKSTSKNYEIKGELKEFTFASSSELHLIFNGFDVVINKFPLSFGNVLTSKGVFFLKNKKIDVDKLMISND